MAYLHACASTWQPTTISPPAHSAETWITNMADPDFGRDEGLLAVAAKCFGIRITLHRLHLNDLGPIVYDPEPGALPKTEIEMVLFQAPREHYYVAVFDVVGFEAEPQLSLGLPQCARGSGADPESEPWPGPSLPQPASPEESQSPKPKAAKPRLSQGTLASTVGWVTLNEEFFASGRVYDVRKIAADFSCSVQSKCWGVLLNRRALARRIECCPTLSREGHESIESAAHQLNGLNVDKIFIEKYSRVATLADRAKCLIPQGSAQLRKPEPTRSYEYPNDAEPTTPAVPIHLTAIPNTPTSTTSFLTEDETSLPRALSALFGPVFALCQKVCGHAGREIPLAAQARDNVALKVNGCALSPARLVLATLFLLMAKVPVARP